MMRVLFFLILLAGLAAIAYPSLSPEAGHDIGSWQVTGEAGVYAPIEVPLQAKDAPVTVDLEMTIAGWLPGNGAALAIVADSDGRTVLAKPLTFAGAKPRDINPQKQEKIYRDNAGVIANVEDATYRFTIAPGDAEGASIAIRSVRLILQTASSVDPRIRPVGIVLAAIGFIGFVLALARGGAPRNPNSQPPQRQWGRGGST